jgi:hypothetical protein
MIDADAGERGLIDTELLRNQLTLLGHPSENVDEMLYIADRRCVGKISYMQYWNALLPYIFENRIRHIASTIHPIFRSEEALPDLESITPPTSPRPAHDEGDFSRLTSGISRLPSAASSIVSAVSHAAQQIARGISRLPSLGRGVDGDGKVDAQEFNTYLPDLAMEPRHNGAEIVSLRGFVLHSGGTSAPYAGINGEYMRSGELINGRALYVNSNRPSTAMWWANNDGKPSWLVGQKDYAGTNKMWAYLHSFGWGPEQHAEGVWQVYSYNSESYEAQHGATAAAGESLPGSPKPMNQTQDAKGHGEHAHQDANPQAPRDELAELAGQIMERSMLFYALDLKVTRAFLRHATQLTLQPGEHLYNEDDEIPCISVVRSGSLMLYRPAEEEGTIGEAAMHAIVISEQAEPKLEAFGRLEAGDVIGEMNCLLKEACSVVFRAETKTRLLQIPRRDLFKMLPRNSREVPVRVCLKPACRLRVSSVR